MTDYARIVTSSTEMEELLSLVRMKGVGTDGKTKDLVEDAVVQFGDESVSCKALDPMKSIWTHIRGPFEDVRSDGRLLLGDIEHFTGYLGRFGERVILAVEEQDGVFHLTFDDEERKTGQYTATDEAHIDSFQDVDRLPYSFDQGEYSYPGAYEETPPVLLDTHFRCNVSDLAEVTNDGDTTDVRKYPIEVDAGTVRIRVGDDEGWIETEFDPISSEGSASSLYGYGMDNVFSNLDGEIDVYLTDGGPMWLHQDEDEGEIDYQIDYMIAEDESQ